MKNEQADDTHYAHTVTMSRLSWTRLSACSVADAVIMRSWWCQLMGSKQPM